MGVPFPLALRGLEQPLVPWAWGINGCASVVSAALATLIAVDFGFRAVLVLALALYVVILAVFPRGTRREDELNVQSDDRAGGPATSGPVRTR
jgi:membrane protein implicated in regulation of membrane protease activity